MRGGGWGGGPFGERLNNVLRPAPAASAHKPVQGGLHRVADVPIYAADAVERRAASLQATADAAQPKLRMNGEELKKVGLQPGAQAKISQGEGSVQLAVAEDNGLPAGVARVAAGHPATAALGAMFGTIKVERA